MHTVHVPSALGVFTLCTVRVSSLHRVRVLSAHGACPLGTGCLSRVRRVLVPSAHRAELLCTGCTSPLHSVYVPSARGARPLCRGLTGCLSPLHRAHGVPVPFAQSVCQRQSGPWRHISLTGLMQSGAERSPLGCCTPLPGCLAECAPRTPLPQLPWVPRGDAWSPQTTSAS